MSASPLVVRIGETTLSPEQVDLLYKAIARVAGDLGQRLALNRFDEEALEMLNDAAKIAALLHASLPIEPAAVADE